jgi:hypothetical protein
MKNIFLMLLLLCSNAWAVTFTDLKFGQAQIADSQWNVSACMYTSTCQIYSKNPGTAYKIPWSSGQLSWAAGDYVAFVTTGNSTNPYNAIQYSSNGTQKAVMGTGHIINMGTDYFFFVGNDNNTGQLFSMTQGFNNTAGVTWTGTLNPTTQQVNTLAAGGSTTPLAAGQTAGPPPPAPTAIYNNSQGVYITRAIPTTSNSPGGEGPNNAFDNNPYTKYLNFDKKNAGVTVQLNTGRVVTGFTITTANDFSGRDPTSYKLYGSNDGSTWTLIKEDTITLSETRYWTSPVINVTNTTAYAYYFIVFPTTKAGDGCGLNCNSMQIAEITFYYDANNTATSTATSNNIVDPVTAAATPPFNGTVTQTNGTNSTITDSGSVITSAQEARVNIWNPTGSASGNGIYIDQVGNNNIISITQIGDNNTVKGIGQTDSQIRGDGNNIAINQGVSGTAKNTIEMRVLGSGSNTLSLNQARTTTGVATGSNGHYQLVDINGQGNSLTTQQSNAGSGSNYLETTIIGNSNNVINKQTDNSNKIMFSSITGNNNTIEAVQKGAANHYLDVKLTGNFNSASVVQEGTTVNKATIDLTNSGGPASVILNQTGNANFSITQTCYQAAGCTTTVKQP